MKLRTTVFGMLAMVASAQAAAGIEDYVAGGGGGMVSSDSAMLAGGAAKAGKAMQFYVSVENPNSSVQCYIGDFVSGELFDAFYTNSGTQLSYYPWTPPYDMVFLLICGQNTGTSGATIAYGRYMTPRSKGEAIESAAPATGVAPIIPASLMEQFQRARGQ